MSIVAVSLAVISASAAAVVTLVKRAEVARSVEAAAASEAETAEAEARRATKEKEAEVEKRRAAEATQKAKEADLAARQAETAKAELDNRTAAENQKAKAAEAKTAQARAAEATAQKETAKAEAQRARDEKAKAVKLAEAEASKAQAEADRLATEKLRSEKAIAEVKALELRKLDLEAVERNLLEWRADLEERERALQPEKTISDLSWAGGMDDTIIDADGNITKKVREPYDPEKDRTLPAPSRRLAKAERLRREAFDADAGKLRARIVSDLEKLYVVALRANDVINAEFYRKSLKSLYPDWEFAGEDAKKETEKK